MPHPNGAPFPAPPYSEEEFERLEARRVAWQHKVAEISGSVVTLLADLSAEERTRVLTAAIAFYRLDIRERRRWFQ